MPPLSRFAICNELFQDQPMESVCRQICTLGYQGIEIAPFTLSADPAQLSVADRAGIRRIVTDAGLEFVGLHWLLAAPPDLHCTARDENVRKRTWDYVHHFIDLCADLSVSTDGNNGVVVFGSPKQRSSRDGLSGREASDIFTHELAHVAPHAESRGVKILVEALSPDQTDVITSLADAVCIVKQIGSPAIQTMFDTHNAVKESEPHTYLVRKYLPYIKHVHVNEMDGREPGTGDYDFATLLGTLSDLNYSGWVSLEAFDFSRDAGEIATRAIHHLKALSSAAGASA